MGPQYVPELREKGVLHLRKARNDCGARGEREVDPRLRTAVFVQCILVPRYLALTGSVPATVALGGLTYALLHVTDGWTDFTSPTDVLLSVLYVLLFYPGPGMVKAFLTVRTGNAWVHVWAYHAIAPHTLLDSPMIVNVFGIR